MTSVERAAYTAFFIGFLLVSLAMPVTTNDLAKDTYKLKESLNDILVKMRNEDLVRHLENENKYPNNGDSAYPMTSILLGYILGLQKSGENTPTSAVDNDESRCGVPDTNFDPNAPGEYESQSKWISKLNRATGLYTLKYTFANRRTPQNIKFQDYEKIVTLAMCSWELVSNVRFRYVGMRSKSADVSLSFERGNHRDGYPFDGRGGVLGHAFYPEDGRLHLDITENWYIAETNRGQSRKKDLYTAVLHELGHTIGLKHSKEKRSVMSKSYNFRGLFQSFDMPKDDIDGAASLYKKRKNFNPVEESYSACKRAHYEYSVKIGNPSSVNSKSKTPVKFEEKVCEDHERHAAVDCPKWKLGGLCDRKIFESTLKVRCPKTCGHCTVNTSHKKASSYKESSISETPMQDSLTTYDNNEVAT